MVGDQGLAALDDPRQIADAQLATLAQRQRERQAGRVRQRPGAGRETLRIGGGEAVPAQLFRARKIQTKEITVFVSHRIILTCACVFESAATQLRVPDAKASSRLG